MAAPRQSLGRGLGALLAPPRYANVSDEYFFCPITDLAADPLQPRQSFDPTSLDELVQSVREKGILQPLIVRKVEAGYVVIAGERRLRAATLAGLSEVPVLVKDVASQEALELALIENIQREDLNPIEEAQAYRRLLDRPGMTQETLAHRVGKSRSAIANSMRLLGLDSELQAQVLDGRLSAGHARALLAIEDTERRTALAERAVREGLTVRDLEQEGKKARPQRDRKPTAEPGGPLKPYCDSIAREISEALGVPASVSTRGRKGKLVISFQGVDELRRLRDLIAAE
ncbi:MAG: ParB/RepB/Spo0J family partition protein [Deltaproteobacteria bacterium]|nr:ParB/RepB/Spo0J family partition protein [Deltaproteobacteria bacterium]MCB9785506.1 ParB/RepB/Spo0J family partition protein [Deltaproteobacteria bacterium]